MREQEVSARRSCGEPGGEGREGGAEEEKRTRGGAGEEEEQEPEPGRALEEGRRPRRVLRASAPQGSRSPPCAPSRPEAASPVRALVCPSAPWLLRTTLCAQVKWHRAARSPGGARLRRGFGAETPVTPKRRPAGVRAGPTGDFGTRCPPRPCPHHPRVLRTRLPLPTSPALCSGLSRQVGTSPSNLWRRRVQGVDSPFPPGSPLLPLIGLLISPLLTSLALNGFVLNIGPRAIA